MSKRYTVRPYQASVTVTVPSEALRLGDEREADGGDRKQDAHDERVHDDDAEVVRPPPCTPNRLQQNPQPPSGVIVKREWLKFCGPNDKPEKFDQIIQSWDTANMDTELSNYSVCTTWGWKKPHMFLLDVYRRKVEFPDLKRAVRELAALHRANIVLVEDKASGSSLIQELRSEHFSLVQAAPAIDGDKVMRLRAQTAKIEGGFVLFPKEAHWLETYLLELVTFPNSKNDDQVDSTVFALAWSTSNPGWHGWTDESLKGLENLCAGLAFNRVFG